uniref:Heat shock 70 kDa protein n=1 Tax=Euglena gracilis TaxID=3039 RepID=A0AA51YE70_EUGGR|nr:heat shock 70 kDa protein [Euglena gracilis]BDX17135.1 heat shock 70 kDa protein family A 4 [Euglena gracilis]
MADTSAKANEAKKLGNAAYTKKDYAAALGHFTEAIRLDPTDHVFYSNRSACRAQLKDVDGALADAQKCVELAPQWAKGYSRLGASYYAAGELRKSLQAYGDGLKLEPGSAVLTEGLVLTQKALAAKASEIAENVRAAQQEIATREATRAAAAAEAQAQGSNAGSNGHTVAEDIIVGIDLGTTFSCVSVWRDGRVQVLPNAVGERTTPSYVAFTEEGERLIGQPAKAQAARNPGRTFYNIKRIIGQGYHEALEEVKRFPFDVKEKDGKPVINIDVEGKPRSFAPEEISAMVLEQMKRTAEANLGFEVKRAVITVPAYFNDAQRRSTQTAAAIAGLKVERIINEPTAAALAYGLDKQTEGLVLVFDLGGGTFDVSLLQIEGGMFKVLATAGDTHLGGEDFDAAMQDHLIGVFKKQNKGKDVIGDNPRACRQLRNACERAKRMLSSAVSADVEITVNGEEYNTSISRATFEKLNGPLFERCLASVKRVLDDAKVSRELVDQVVLVGGSTRIPRVQELLQEYFNGKQLCKSVNPDEAVAYGAAVQGAVLSGVRDKAMNALILVDVCPLTLGIETEGRVFAKVVPRNTSVPCSRTREFTTVEDYQTSVDVRVFEGERSITDGNHLLGEFVISGIERAKRGVPKIDVTFEINVSGLLTVTARDQTTGANAKIAIQNDRGRHSQEDVERMIAEAERLRLVDEQRVREAEQEYAEEDD